MCVCVDFYAKEDKFLVDFRSVLNGFRSGCVGGAVVVQFSKIQTHNFRDNFRTQFHLYFEKKKKKK